MAYIKANAILTRIREVLEDGQGSLRSISSTRFAGDLPEGLDPTEDARRAISAPRIEAKITGISRHSQSPPVTGNMLLYSVAIEVRVVRTVTRTEQLTDDDRVTLQALAAEDTDVVRQALEWPGNLTQTEAAVTTDLASGLLRYASTKDMVRGAVNGGAQTMETVHSFTGVVISRPATTQAAFSSAFGAGFDI